MEIWEAGRWDGKPVEEGGKNKGAEKVEGTRDESTKNKLRAFCEVMDTSERETGRTLTLSFEVTFAVWMGQGYDWRPAAHSAAQFSLICWHEPFLWVSW